jgi:hypothetical protein
MNAGADQAFDAKVRVERKPAKINVSASYASKCGIKGHSGIVVEPQGGEVAICKPLQVDGDSVSFEAFRLPTVVERQRAMLNAGALGTVARMLFELVNRDTACGSVIVRCDSCGLRLAGSTVGSLAARIQLYSEDEVSITLKLPPIGAVSWSRDKKETSSSGELQVKQKEDKSGYEKTEDEHKKTDEAKSRGQSFAGYSEQKITTEKNGDQTKVSNLTTSGYADSLTAITAGYKEGDAWNVAKEADHSGFLNYLAQRGFDLSLTWNGLSVGVETIKEYAEIVAAVDRSIAAFRELWAAGPGVKVAVGWQASWNLSFLQLSLAYKGFRKVSSGRARLHQHHEVTGDITAVAGSASAGFGLLVEVRRLGLKVLALDFQVTLTLAGNVKASLKWTTDIKAGEEKSKGPMSQPVSGEVKLTLAATGTAEMCGRTIGCTLAVSSGLSVEGELKARPLFFENIEVKRLPILLTVKVYIGSNGEPDLVETHELWKEKESLFTYPDPRPEAAAPAVAT